MGARGQQTLSEVTAAQHLALVEGDVSEVGPGRTALVAPEGLKFPIVDKAPLLQRTPPLQHVCTTAGQRGLATGSVFRCDIHLKQDCSIWAEHPGFPADHPGDPLRLC